MPYEWLGSCLDKMNGDETKLEEFVRVVKEVFEISDIHIKNVGYCNNFPVIIDYAGYNESY